MDDDLRTILVRCSGHDRPGITADLLRVLARGGAALYDMEQVVVRERLTLSLLVGIGAGGAPDETRGEAVLDELRACGAEHGLDVELEAVEPTSSRAALPRSVVTVIGETLPPDVLAAVASAIARGGGNIDRIVRLARYPVVAYELTVVAGDLDRMRDELLVETADRPVDVAIQRQSLERRGKRLVVMDVDSTLIQDEVIEMLAAEAGCEAEVAEITARAMEGELDFAASLRERVARLAGTPETAIDRVAERIRLTPGARTLVRTLKRLGYTVAIVSGGFVQVTDRLAAQLGIDHAFANRLEIVDGVLTGRLEGDILDRAGKAEVLRRIAEAERIPLDQTVAIGDGANDLDMLATAGLGVAFNARPVVRERADTAVSVPYLDAVLFLLGIRREEVEDADARDADPAVASPERIAVPGLPAV